MIKFENVTKKYDDVVVLDGLCLSVPKGSIYGLMGLNGAGKTTVIKHLADLIRQDSGEVSIEGEKITDNEALKKRMFIIPDELYFYKGYNMNEMGKYYSSIYPLWNEERYREMIADFGLDPKKNIGKFSKGMKKQAAFCIAMSTEPDYLVLDEPIDGLDPIVRHKLRHYIMSDVADREMTVLVSSHNAKEMEDVCNYVGILAKGKMIFEGNLLEMEEVSIEELFMEKLGGDIYE